MSSKKKAKHNTVKSKGNNANSSSQEVETKVISFYNFKGGVGKTTNVYTAGWSLVKKNKRVVLIDADPQMSLSSSAVDAFSNSRSLEDLIMEEGTIYKALNNPDQELILQQIDNSELYILLGDMNLIHFQEALSRAYLFLVSDANFAIRINALSTLIDKIKKQFKPDFIIFDLSPSYNTWTRHVLSLSHGWVMSASPNEFSVSSIYNIMSCLRNRGEQNLDFNYFWDSEVAVRNHPNVRLPPIQTKLIGYILNMYRIGNQVNTGEPASVQRNFTSNERQSVDKIEELMNFNDSIVHGNRGMIAAFSDFAGNLNSAQLNGLPPPYSNNRSTHKDIWVQDADNISDVFLEFFNMV